MDPYAAPASALASLGPAETRGPFARRVLVTLAGLFAYQTGLAIPLPGLELDALHEASRNPLPTFGLFGPGINPYLVAVTLTLWASGLFQRLRRIRDEEPARFDGILLPVTALLAAIQSWGIAKAATFLAQASGGTGGSPLLFIAGGTGGALAAFLLARLLTRHGCVNGVALLVFVGSLEYLRSLGPFLTGSSRDPVGGHFTVLLTVAALMALVGLIVVVALARSGFTATGPRGESLTVPFRGFVVGATPARVALAIGAFAASRGGSPMTDAVLGLLVVLPLAILLHRASFDPADAARRLDASGFGLEAPDGRSIGAMTTLLERAHRERFRLQLGIQVILVACPAVLSGLLGLDPVLGGALLELFVFVVLAIDLGTGGFRARAVPQDHVLLAEVETRLDAALLDQRLRAAGIDAALLDDRAIGLSGSLGLWEISRPRFPSLCLFPRLGGGRVSVWVPAARFRDAESLRQAEMTEVISAA